jgi:uncharacterized membrane protein
MELAIIGIIIDMLGCLCTALGWAIQKKLHNDIEGTGKMYITQRLWWVGMLLVLLAQPLYLTAIWMVKISILGVIGPFSILASMVLAYLFLHEKIRLWDYVGMTLFIPGSILTLWFSNLENKRYNREEFHVLFYSTRSMIYLFLSISVMIIMMIVCHIILKLNPGTYHDDDYHQQVDDQNYTPENAQNHNTAIQNLRANVVDWRKLSTETDEDIPQNCFSKIIENTALFDLLFGNPRLRFLPLLVYPYFGPFVSGISITLARWLAGFASSDPSENQTSNFVGVEPWLYAIFIPFGALFSYLVVNKSLQHYDTIYVVPLFKVGDLMHHILSGAIFLKELSDYSSTELSYFIIGVVICTMGVLMLLLSNDQNERERLEAKQLFSDQKFDSNLSTNAPFSSKIELT